MAQKQMVTGNLPTFINGALVPPNTPVLVDDEAVDLDDSVTDDNGKAVKGKTRDIGLRERDSGYTPPVAAPMAAIGPTGPNPTAPQQVPPDTLQTGAGYAAIDGTPLVAEGSEAAIQVEEGGESTRSRRGKKTDDALS